MFSLFFFLPAFAANPSAVIAKGKIKMDFGKKLPDGKRIFGEGKSWRGFFGGILFGYITGLLCYVIAYALGASVNYPFTFTLISFAILALSAGSMSGDLVGSFLKRRIGMESGQNGFLIDQYPFVIFALLFLLLASSRFFYSIYWNIPAVLSIIIITPPLHRIVNIIGFRIGRKNVPW